MFKTGYNEEENEQAAKNAALECTDESLTHQSFAEDSDLNVIVRRMGLGETAIRPEALDPSYFGDLTEAPRDLAEVFALVQDAQAKFRSLSSDTRAKFFNDPRNLWSWLQDPANRKEAVELGLLHPVASTGRSGAFRAPSPTSQGAAAPPADSSAD